MSEITATEKARDAAREIIVYAAKAKRVITRTLVDEVLSGLKGTHMEGAHVRTVRREVRKLATERPWLTLALTDAEEQREYRRHFHQLTRPELLKIVERMHDDPTCPQGFDKNYVQALYSTLRATAPRSMRSIRRMH